MKKVKTFRGLGSVQDPLPLQAFDTSLRSGTLLGEDRSQACHRTAPIQDQDGLAVADLIDESAEAILGFGESSRLHESQDSQLDLGDQAGVLRDALKNKNGPIIGPFLSPA
jgi:hypothetical protein